jgi:hypothetical protein
MDFSIHGAKYSSLNCEKLAPLTAALYLLTLFSFVNSCIKKIIPSLKLNPNFLSFLGKIEDRIVLLPF